jgi:formate/nitrite transporter FocA (FNT family)
MAGAILALGAVVTVTITMQTGSALLGAAFFPIGFCVLYLMGFDLLTGVFVLTPLAWLNRRTGVTIPRILTHWGKVFVGISLTGLTLYTTHVKTAPENII